MAPLLKSGGRKPLEVRLLYPPPVKKGKIQFRPTMAKIAKASGVQMKDLVK